MWAKFNANELSIYQNTLKITNSIFNINSSCKKIVNVASTVRFECKLGESAFGCTLSTGGHDVVCW